MPYTEVGMDAYTEKNPGMKTELDLITKHAAFVATVSENTDDQI
jgi:hypothetical protein